MLKNTQRQGGGARRKKKMRKMPFYGSKCTKRICKKKQQQQRHAGGIAAYSKTAKLLIKLTYTVKSYLMDYGWGARAWVDL
jgi:hypothetical protein